MSIFDTKPDNVFGFSSGPKKQHPYQTSDIFEKHKESTDLYSGVIEKTQTFEMIPGKEEIKQLVKDDLEKLHNIAKDFEITDQSTFDRATEMVLQSKKIEGAIEKCRKKLVRPHVDMQKNINDFAREFSKVCNNIFSDLNFKRGQYERAIREEELKKQKEENERIRLQNEKLLQENKKAELINEAQESKTNSILQIAPKPIKKYTDGSVQKKKVWSFEIVSFEDIPHEFLQINESEIKALITAGGRKIPGIRIFEEEKEIFRSRR